MAQKCTYLFKKYNSKHVNHSALCNTDEDWQVKKKLPFLYLTLKIFMTTSRFSFREFCNLRTKYTKTLLIEKSVFIYSQHHIRHDFAYCTLKNTFNKKVSLHGSVYSV